MDIDKYTTSLPYPSKPTEPSILRVMAKNLSAEEMASVPAVLAEYRAALQAYTDAVDARKLDQLRLDEEFKIDLEAHVGTTGNPKADLLYRKAYEMGHGSGKSEVATIYNDLADLIL